MLQIYPGNSDVQPENNGAPFAVLASDINRYVLDNGMAVLTKEVYPSKVVFLSFWARVGSSYETDEEAGISHFVEHMLFKNTKKRAVGQVAQEIHALGGYLNGFTSFDCTAYWMVLPGSSVPKAMEILYDAIFNPLIDPKEMDKELNVILEEINMYDDRPADFLSRKLIGEAIKKHRYGRPVIGFEETLRNFSQEDLVNYYKHYYRPNNCFITAVGNIDSMDFLKKAERTFRKLKEGKVEKSSSPKEPPQKEMNRFELEGDIQTSHLQLAFHIPSIFHRDVYPLSLLSTILGSGVSSRLYRELREKRKLVNDITAYSYIQKDPCLMFIEAELSAKHVDETEKAIFEIIENIQKDGLTDREFQMARNLAESSYIFRQETVESLGRSIGFAEVRGDYMLSEKFVQRLMQVDKKEIEKASRKYLIPKNCTLGIYTPK